MAVKKEGVTYDEIVRSVRAGNFAPVYYLMGEEAYYIDKVSEFIVDTVLKEEEKDFNLTVCYGTDVTADEVINAAKRFPMMAERQVVLVREAQSLPGKERLSFYLEHPQPSTVLNLVSIDGIPFIDQDIPYRAVRGHFVVALHLHGLQHYHNIPG